MAFVYSPVLEQSTLHLSVPPPQSVTCFTALVRQRRRHLVPRRRPPPAPAPEERVGLRTLPTSPHASQVIRRASSTEQRPAICSSATPDLSPTRTLPPPHLPLDRDLSVITAYAKITATLAPLLFLPHRKRSPDNTAKLSSTLLQSRGGITFAEGVNTSPPTCVQSATRKMSTNTKDKDQRRRRRSSSLMYQEPPESLEQQSDQAILPNLNAQWVNAKGE